MLTRRGLLSSGGAFLACCAAARSAFVAPLPASLVSLQTGFNVKPEDFGTPTSTQGPYGFGWETVVMPALQSSGARLVRIGAAAPSGDSQAHKDEFFARVKEIVSAGIKISAVAPFTQTTARIEFNFTSSGRGWVQVEGDNEPASCATAEADLQSLWSAIQGSTLLGPSGANAQVCAPSLTTFACAATTYHMSASCNFGNKHAYIHGKNPEAPGWMTSYLAQAQATTPGKPIIISELGYRSVQPSEVAGQNKIPGVPDKIIARYVPRWVLYNLNLGFVQNIFHQLADNHAPSATDEQSGYGFIDYYGTLKPQFTALASLIKVFSDASTSITPTPLDCTLMSSATDVHSVLFQRSNGQYLLAFWRGISAWNDTTYTVITNSGVPATITLPASVTTGTLVRFLDDGLLSKSPVRLINGVLNVIAADQLNVLVF
jgi:hypothetical protein